MDFNTTIDFNAGDEVWFINRYAGKPLYYGKDVVQMVGF